MGADRADAGQRFEIRVRGHLAHRWAAWFEPMTLCHEPGGTTVLRGPVVDQAALHGLLGRLQDLAVPLVSVVPTSQAPAGPPVTGP